MKLIKLILFIFLLIPFSTNLWSQDEDIDSLQFESHQTAKPKKAYFAVGVGFTGSFLYNKLDDLNNHFGKNFLVDNLKGPVFLPGFHIIAALPIIPGTRIGFFNMTGSKLSEKTINIDTQSVTRDIEFSTGMTGFNFDYNIGLISNLVIIPGISLGWGNIKLESSSAKNPFDWNSNKLVSDSLNFINRAEATFTFVQPNLYIEYALLPYLMVRVNVGYNFSFALGGNLKWTYDRTASLSNPPAINASGLTMQFGIFLGLFNYYSSGM